MVGINAIHEQMVAKTVEQQMRLAATPYSRHYRLCAVPRKHTTPASSLSSNRDL